MSMHQRQGRLFAGREDPAFNISALIDVAFLLLIYFLVTTTLNKEETELSLLLPGIASVSSGPVRVDQMRVEILGNGTITVNGEPLDADPGDHGVPVLTERLVRYAGIARVSQSDPLVVVRCNPLVSGQRFIDVLNACARAEIGNISLNP
ncbi:MAG: biopolymer transporter ExbD [Verrucomicrobiales bacterium]|nr:biopolymer transporter ExbD [Verrucomicrobiales bacterium]